MDVLVTAAATSSRMATKAYRTLLEVLQRGPGTSGTGAPSGEWFVMGQHWGEVLEQQGAPGGEVAASAGQRAVRRLALRLRWFPGWESVFRADYRGRVDGVHYAILSSAEEAGAGTERTIRVDLQSVRP